MLRDRIAAQWRRTVAAGSALVAATAGLLTFGVSPAQAGAISGELYVNPDNQVQEWLNANPNDPKAALIQSAIADQPIARWLATVNVATVRNEVASYVGPAHAAGKIPQLVIYGMPNRDCGGASAGGAATFAEWQNWISEIGAGLGSQTVIILLEPDAVALTDCLDAAGIVERNDNIKQAVATLKAANPNVKIYLDAGHSEWHAPNVIAQRLVDAGVADTAGFYTNPSNYQPTADEAAFGANVINALAGLGVTGVGQIIDTSRNGNGDFPIPWPNNIQPNGWPDWCDYTEAAVGDAPTTDTGYAHVDAFLWIKPAGESDGCSARAGVFIPDAAYRMAGGNIGTPSCTVDYQITNTWQNGGEDVKRFGANLVITNGTSVPTSGWVLSIEWAGDQSPYESWNSTHDTIKPFGDQPHHRTYLQNAAWNAAIQPSGNAYVGFNGQFTIDPPEPTAVALNGIPCTIV